MMPPFANPMPSVNQLLARERQPGLSPRGARNARPARPTTTRRTFVLGRSCQAPPTRSRRQHRLRACRRSRHRRSPHLGPHRPPPPCRWPRRSGLDPQNERSPPLRAASGTHRGKFSPDEQSRVNRLSAREPSCTMPQPRRSMRQPGAWPPSSGPPHRRLPRSSRVRVPAAPAATSPWLADPLRYAALLGRSGAIPSSLLPRCRKDTQGARAELQQPAEGGGSEGTTSGCRGAPDPFCPLKD
jgi:hypothetical protein